MKPTLVESRSSGSAPGRERWSSQRMFILAAAGAAIGLGNIWKFPYIAGEYGGGAFVVVYILCVALIGLPILIAEILLGRRGGHSPIRSFARLASANGRSRGWQIVGWNGVVGTFLILSFFSVVAGWAIAYIPRAALGAFSGDAAGDAAAVGKVFSELLADPLAVIFWHSVFMAATIAITAQGVARGLERVARYLTPVLFALLLTLVGHSALTTGHFLDGFRFLFRPDFSSLTGEAVFVALGHACFTLSIGVCSMMAYGSFLPKRASVAGAAVTIACLDTAVALLAGLAIFPIAFASGLEASEGPGLIFLTLPVAFGTMPAGQMVGTAFFVFMALAALTSGPSLLEPSVEYLVERLRMRRHSASLLVGSAAWLVGLASALAFNVGAELKLFGMSAFDLLDFITSTVLLPLGGMLIAVFAGWAMASAETRQELALGERAFKLWRFAIRFLAPAGVLTVFLAKLL